MYYCMLCGERLRWQCDYDVADFGYYGEGVINICECQSCRLGYEAVCVEGENPIVQIIRLEDEE